MALDFCKTWNSVRGLVFFGWMIASMRLLLEMVAPEQARFFGVYYVMPAAYLYYGLTGKLDGLTWPRMATAMVTVAFFVWFVPNALSYTTAQFMGWEYGRFAPASSGPINTTIGAKIQSGLITASQTFVGGSLWSIVWGSLLIWLPGRWRKRQE